MTIALIVLCIVSTSLAYHFYQTYKTNQESLNQAVIDAASLRRDNEYLEIASGMNQATMYSLEQRLIGYDLEIEERFEAWKITHEKTIRKDALTRSRSVIRGQATEHLAPFIQSTLDPKDFRFMGDPLDYLVCVGSSAIADKKSDRIEQIILMDIKTGKAQLSKVQRRIRDAVVAGRVSFQTYNPDTKETREWKLKIPSPVLPI